MRRHLHRLVLLLIDVALIAAATLLALVLRDNFEVSLPRLQALLPYFSATLVAAAVVLVLSGANRAIWRFSVMSDYLRVTAATIAIVLIAVALTFLMQRLDGVARALPVIQGLLMLTLLIGVRVSMRFRHVRRQRPAAPDDHLVNPSVETTLLVGLTPVTDLFLRSVAEFGPQRLRIAGILGCNERQRGRNLHQYPILGTPEEVERILKELEVHGVFIGRILVMMAFTDLSPEAQQALLDVERTSNIRLDFIAERLGLVEEKSSTEQSTDPTNELPYSLVAIEAAARRPYFTVKRLIDFVVALGLILMALPLALLVALVVAFDVGYPVLFWQQRPGMGGHPFRLYKFRTMRAAHDHAGRRIPDDRRLSPIGQFLRRTRLDELPQLYNVLIGDMSFIGPRPLLPIDQHAEFAARLLIKPGLTGWAQVAGGREISARDKAALDIWYVRNASLATDARVIVRTLPMILYGERPNQHAMDEAWEELRAFDAQYAQETRAFGLAPSISLPERSAM